MTEPSKEIGRQEIWPLATWQHPFEDFMGDDRQEVIISKTWGLPENGGSVAILLQTEQGASDQNPDSKKLQIELLPHDNNSYAVYARDPSKQVYRGTPTRVGKFLVYKLWQKEHRTKDSATTLDEPELLPVKNVHINQLAVNIVGGE